MSVTQVVLNNLPEAYGEATIKDFVEGTLDIDVRGVVTSNALPGKALINFYQEIDFSEASKVLRQTSIEGKVVFVFPATIVPDTVVVNDVDTKFLSEEFLTIYFCAMFGNGEDVVASCKMLHKFSIAIVTFKENCEAMTCILANKDHVPLPSKNYHIVVEPFYKHFHSSLMID
ncbi:hypothetical protein PoB_000866700 [Plakobranchus ocellatus]|uniref:RRM domain-containing protein n=1 Tax=Plakobranchus ocellatus TaxID=259542 RepID=A0AAV3YJ02_9GAST|nr:hypothetical protein PoB_000866700 [Plakobranchus ocellatus]